VFMVFVLGNGGAAHRPVNLRTNGKYKR